MKRKLLWMIMPMLIVVAACSELNRDKTTSESHKEASAENQGTDTDVITEEDQLWQLLYQNRSDETTLKEMEDLFDEGISPDTVNNDGVSPITYAVMEGDSKLVEFLLLNGVEVHDHEASDHDEDAEVNHEKNENLLEVAVEQGNNEIVDLLLKMGAHFEIGNEEMLVKAVKEENIELIKILLHNGYNPNLEIEVEGEHDTLLTYSIVQGNEETIALLLDSGANPNFTVEKNDESALVTAVTKEKSTELVSLLLGRGGDANARYEGDPLLFEAIKQDNSSLVEAFLVAGALPSSIEESEEAFALLEESDHTAVADLLQQYGW